MICNKHLVFLNPKPPKKFGLLLNQYEYPILKQNQGFRVQV